MNILGLDYGLGWLLDVAPHPNYEKNGWIYLVHTDLCAECKAGGDALIPSTMVRLIRGRIDDSRWVDEAVIWSVPEEFYSSVPDLAAGGRLAFGSDGDVEIGPDGVILLLLEHESGSQILRLVPVSSTI